MWGDHSFFRPRRRSSLGHGTLRNIGRATTLLFSVYQLYYPNIPPIGCLEGTCRCLTWTPRLDATVLPTDPSTS
ncbi:hypothetical protein BDZ94DRAFT_1252332 [Collybia nuda]|uniref:Uncharacterized protein n=1 Tax=Collybia nuda TaxID=64659 RepID=A0A9P5YE60_9AGAR|nr:hypothetical protein BDZ94DRAFT_1252332 [Collybia nuda]